MTYGYVRVSTDRQRVDNQEYEIERFCKKNNIKIDEWIKETISGTKTPDKRKLGGLLEKIKPGDLIICAELSRLGRTLFMIMNILNKLMEIGAKIWTIKDNYRLGDDIQSKVLAFAFGLSAEIEWNKIPTKSLPLRDQRWCCEQLKEFGGRGRYCITGVRWAESSRRANERGAHEITGKTKAEHIIFNNDNDMRRKLSEMCLVKRNFVLNPIIDWTDDDVWEFLNERKVPVNPLYGQGWKRIGCIGCPMSGNAGRNSTCSRNTNAHILGPRRNIGGGEKKGKGK